MAIVLNPLNSSVASGSVGGLNYTRWRGRAVVRSKCDPSQPGSAAQLAVWTDFSTVVGRWKTVISDDERDQWREAASQQRVLNRVGEVYVPSGFQYFMSLNQALLSGGELPIDVPPVDLPDVKEMDFTASWNMMATVVELSFFDYQGVPLTCAVVKIFRAGPFNTTSRQPIEPEFRLLVNASPLAVTTDNTAAAGKYYYYRAKWLDEWGRLGNIHQVRVHTL